VIVFNFNTGKAVMNRLIRLTFFAAVLASVTGCASAPAPVDTGNADAQRSRAEKAQSELGADVSRQRSDSEKR
jgi:outer membrane murein-binding lipoprotein Lpp